MLRKKLSKLILVGLVCALGASFTGGASAGQVVMAQQTGTENAVLTIKDVTTLEELKTALADQNVTTINLKGAIKLGSAGSADTLDVKLLSEKLAKGTLTINVMTGGSITLTEGTTLNGSDKLTITRDASNKTSVINFDAGVSSATIQGVKFDGGQDSTVGLINVTGLTKGNIKVMGTVDNGALFTTDPSTLSGILDVTGVTRGTNGTLFVGQTTPVTDKITVSVKSILGTSVDITGTTTVPNTNVNLVLTDATGKEISRITVKSDATGNFTHSFTGLTVNTIYSLKADATMNNALVTAELKDIKTTGVKSSVTNIGNNNATIIVDRAGLNGKLDVVVKEGTSTITAQIFDQDSQVVVNGLKSGTSYIYDIRDVNGNVVATGSFKTASETISGGSGSEVVNADITPSDIRKATINDVKASIPVANKTLIKNLEEGSNLATNVRGVSIEVLNGEVVLTGLVPEKEYKDLTITYTDRNGRNRTVKVANFTTGKSITKVRQFVKDVYKYALDRIPDEEGFAYWLDQLETAKTMPENFVRNLLNEPEFINRYTTTQDKIEALYQVIVNRKSDAEGLKYWTEKYDAIVKKGYIESIALSMVVDEMVNEQEFKNRVKDLGL